MCARIWLLCYSIRYSRERFPSLWVSAGHHHVPVFRILESGAWHGFVGIRARLRRLMSHCSKEPRKITRRESDVSCLMYFGILSYYDVPMPKLYLLLFLLCYISNLIPDTDYCRYISFMSKWKSDCLLNMCARIWLLYYSVRYSWERCPSSWVSAGHRHVPVFHIFGSGAWQ